MLSRESKIRNVLTAALASGGNGSGLPVPPLIDIITTYSLPTPFMSTFWAFQNRAAELETEHRLRAPYFCTGYVDPTTQQPYLLVSEDSGAVYSIQLHTEAGAAVPVYTGIGGTSSVANICIDPNDHSIITHRNLELKIVRSYVTAAIGASEPKDYTITEHYADATPDILAHAAAGDDDDVDMMSASWSNGFALTSDGRFGYTSVVGRNVVRVDMKSGTHSVVAGTNQTGTTDGPALTSKLESVTQMTFDPYTDVPDSVLYLTAMKSIRVLNLLTQQLSTIRMSRPVDPIGILFVAPNVVLVTCSDDRCLYLVDTKTGATTHFAGKPFTGNEYIHGNDRMVDGSLSESRCYNASNFCILPALPGDDNEFDAFIYLCQYGGIRKIGVPPNWAPPLALTLALPPRAVSGTAATVTPATATATG